MSKVDAERAMEIYRTFTKQTDYVVQYLSVARQYEHHTRVEVPKLKHAPVNLGRQLEDYLKDSDFEIHRRQYIAELEVKKMNGFSGSSSKPFKTEPASKASSSTAFPEVKPQPAAKPAQPAKGPDPDLIDFFDSIEQNQTTMATNPQQQQVAAAPWAGNTPFQAQPTGQFQNGFVAQPTGYNPFQQQQQQQQNFGAFPQQPQAQPQPQPQLQQQIPQQLQPSYTGAGFGGFTPQPSFQPGSLAPIPQDSVASFQTGAQGIQNMQTGQQTTNPFRLSMMMTGQTAMPTGASALSAGSSPTPLQPQSTNPFARSSPQATQPFGAPANNSPFQSPPPAQQFNPAPAPLQPMATGTNPFARNFTGAQPQRPATSGGPLMPQATGTTNPFRQGAFVNHTTGQGWQNNQQAMGGGLDQLETIPVFPRPTQQTPWQQ